MTKAAKPKTPKKLIPTSTEGVELSMESNTQYDMVKSMGIPVKKAIFHRTVESWNGEPEMAFYTGGAKPSRTALAMWFTPHGLLCEFRNSKRKIIPLANVVYVEPV